VIFVRTQNPQTKLLNNTIVWISALIETFPRQL
jgi:hypothetical protein